MEWADGKLTKATISNGHGIAVPKVMVQGEEGDCLFVILGGKAEV